VELSCEDNGPVVVDAIGTTGGDTDCVRGLAEGAFCRKRSLNELMLCGVR
jgi:hypothetical protein